jgi:hypothetical protein
MAMTVTLPVGTINYPYPTSGVLVVSNTIFRPFQNAHFAVLKKKGPPPTGPHMSVMKQWWWEEYGVTIIDDWFALEFASEQALTMFLLRWS